MCSLMMIVATFSLVSGCDQVSLLSCRNEATSLGLFHRSVGVNVVGLLGQLKRWVT